MIIQQHAHLYQANVVILGITFKENCPDTRNSKVVDIINRLKEFEIDTRIIVDKRKYKEPFGNLEITNTTDKYLFLKLIYSFYEDSLSRKKERSKELLLRIEDNVTNRSENINSVNKYKSVVLKWEELLES